MRSRRLAPAAAFGALAIAIAGCGNGGSEQAGRDIGAPALKPGDHVAIETAHGKFDPIAIYRRSAPGVVTILSLFDSTGEQGGQGSGFVLDGNGEIATNAHVVTSGTKADIRRARRVFVEFGDRNRVPAKILGFDPNADVALIKIDPSGLDLHPLKLSTGRVSVGEPVAAIGSPFGQQQSLSVGVVSATDRAVDSLTDFRIDGAIQTDAAINRGNSGGPLLDGSGRVIGINQQIQTDSGGGEGVGFAVPADVISRSLAKLRESGRAAYAFIGITSEPLYPQLAKRLGIDADTGALIAEVVKDGPAAKAGLRGGKENIRFQAQRVKIGGDVIVSIDGRRLRGENDLSRLVGSKSPGDRVKLEIIRDHDRRTVEVTLGRRPSSVP